MSEILSNNYEGLAMNILQGSSTVLVLRSGECEREDKEKEREQHAPSGEFTSASRNDIFVALIGVLNCSQKMARGHQKLQSQAKACVPLLSFCLPHIDNILWSILVDFLLQAGEGAGGQGGCEPAESECAGDEHPMQSVSANLPLHNKGASLNQKARKPCFYFQKIGCWLLTFVLAPRARRACREQARQKGLSVS